MAGGAGGAVTRNESHHRLRHRVHSGMHQGYSYPFVVLHLILKEKTTTLLASPHFWLESKLRESIVDSAGMFSNDLEKTAIVKSGKLLTLKMMGLCPF